MANPFGDTDQGFEDLHYYQGILIVQVALTLIFYFVFKCIHYIKWGYDEEIAAEGKDGAAEERKEQSSEDQTSKKWDQKSWDVYFPIIFTYHIAGIAMIIVYIPFTFSAVIGFLHFLCFLILLILNVCIKDAEPGNGSRTKGTRVIWIIMCFFNTLLMIGGLSGVTKVIK